MEHMSDVTKTYTVTLPNGKQQMFEETKDGNFYYANTSTHAPNFAAGLEKVKAMGGTVEIKTL